MRKTIILTAAMTMWTGAFGQSIEAIQNDSIVSSVALEAVNVVGVDFRPTDPAFSPKSVVVLDPSEWTTGTSVVEALEFTPGVDIQSRGAWGIQSDISIRGGSYEQVALWVDGIRWSAPHTGHHLMNVPLDPEDLSHVEVVKTGGGPWAGIGAFSGSLHMETALNPNTNRATFSAELGSFNWRRSRAHVDWQTGSVTHGLSISKAETSGHTVNSDATIERLRYGVGWTRKEHRLNALFAAEGKRFGAQNFYTSVYPDQYEQTGVAIGQLSWKWHTGHWQFSAASLGRIHSDRFELYREGEDWYQLTNEGLYVRTGPTPDTAASWYSGANLHRSVVAASNAQAQWASGNWRLVAAVDFRNESIRSNRLGQPRLDGSGSDRYTRGDVRQNVDGYAGLLWSNAGWDVTGTMGVNGNSRFGWYGLPAVQLNRTWGDWGGLFASAGRSVRHPSFTDLYYNIGGAVGSEDLLPEQADQLEAGLRWNVPMGLDGAQLMMESTRFFRRGTNLIDWIRYDGSAIFEATNLSEIDFWGGDLTVQWKQPAQDGCHLSNARVSATWMDANRISEGFTSNYVLDFVRVKYDAVVRVSNVGPLTVLLRGSVQERNGEAVFDEAGELLQLWGGEILFDGDDGESLAWKGHVRLDNAFDVQYADRGMVLQPGRMVRFGLTFEWVK